MTSMGGGRNGRGGGRVGQIGGIARKQKLDANRGLKELNEKNNKAILNDLEAAMRGIDDESEGEFDKINNELSESMQVHKLTGLEVLESTYRNNANTRSINTDGSSKAYINNIK